MVPSDGNTAESPTALRLAVLTLIEVLPLTGFAATLERSATAVASLKVFASAFSAARNVAYGTVPKNVLLPPNPTPFWNVILTVIGSENCDSMFAIAVLIVASIAAALASLVMEAANVGLMCKPADTARGAPATGVTLSSARERLAASPRGASPGSTACTIGTGEMMKAFS